MEINSNHSTYGAAFRQKPIFFMSGKETVAYFEGKAEEKYDTSGRYLYTWQQ
ncbi:MAG: hypothetical protein ACLTOM_05415 [Roseburia sp.]